ncbi:piggyBac transposable element-derived protein 3 [Eleutherodactylus coqui]|uniref:piggyBac transposable element-derived protein 3 n=1 Tax=Eleutherodactylus coqui TaxID=57060 RepID=UPI0034623DF9
MARRRYTAEEVYAIIASDSDSASGDDATFLAFSSSSSSSSSSESELPVPPRRRPRTATTVDPNTPDVSWGTPENFRPQIPDFHGNPGIQFDTEGLRARDFFMFFFPDDFIAHIVTQTNLYAQHFIQQNPTSSYARPDMWTPVDPLEIKKFWGLVLTMGLVKKPTIRAYWSTDILYHTPMFRMAMSRTRFEMIQKFLHYNNNAECPPSDHPNYDRLYKIRPVVEHFNFKFAQAYTPPKNIAVDESLVHFKGRLKFRQYLPSKRARYGVKLYKLCESASGYTHKFRIYEGKDTKIEPPECPPVLGVTGKIVWELVHPLLDQGYHLYLDNFYTSVPLFQCLASRGTVACGTIRKNQRSLPKTLLGQLLRRGESRAQCSNNMLCVKYKDKRDVLILTTIHGHSSTPCPVRGTSTETPKPDCVLDYNKNMGGVDLSDQVLEPYNAMRKTRVWYKKLAVHLVQMAMYNAYVLYRGAGQRGTFLEFQEDVIKALIFGEQEVGEQPSTSGSEATRIVPGQHFPSEIPSTGKKGRTQKKCRVCYKQGIRKDTIHHCETCPTQPGLCIKNCFKTYHTSLKF